LSGQEAEIQALQNLLVDEVLEHVYPGGIPVPWAQGRKMVLSYRSYALFLNSSNDRSRTLDFKCRLPDNKTTKSDFVKGIADGAFVPFTDKKSPNTTNSAEWDLQTACLLFEVSLPLPIS